MNSDSGEEVDSDDLGDDLDFIREKEQRRQNAKKYKHEVDTNVFKITMRCLRDNVEIATGDPVFCKNCNGVLNMHSAIVEESKEDQVWVCEFCDTKNNVNVEPEEKPKSETVYYML